MIFAKKLLGGWRVTVLTATIAALAIGAYAAQESPEGTAPPGVARTLDHSKGEASEAGSTQTAGHAAESHHDDSDLSHGNATANLANPADIRFDLAIYTAVVFFVLLALLSKFAWGPISHGLEKREKGIEEKIEHARKAAEDATAQLKLYEAKLAAAADEARAIVAQAHKDGEATRERLTAEAQAATQRERDRAVADIQSAKNEALRDIAKRSVDTAVELAKGIVKREVRADEHERLINDALSGFAKLN